MKDWNGFDAACQAVMDTAAEVHFNGAGSGAVGCILQIAAEGWPALRRSAACGVALRLHLVKDSFV
jgi:hypothetical protein